MSIHKNIAEGLLIFDKYEPNGRVYTDYDVISTDIKNDTYIEPDDKEKLKKLGWHCPVHQDENWTYLLI